MDDFRIIRNNVRNYFNLEYTTDKQNAIQHFREKKNYEQCAFGNFGTCHLTKKKE